MQKDNYSYRNDFYSESWKEATRKFLSLALGFGDVRWVISDQTRFDIPYISIGTGPHKIVINSGIHGIEGYFGSAAQLLFLSEMAPNLSKKLLEKYSIVLIHVINGWGMDNRMREVLDPAGGLVDLNRNFGINFAQDDALPDNKKYQQAHNILISKPHVERGRRTKMHQLFEFRRQHLKDGVWDSIMRGQYYEPYGLAYGGRRAMPENKMTLGIYDHVMNKGNTASLTSIGLHTGLGCFNKSNGTTTSGLYVSHPSIHPSTQKFKEIFGSSVNVIADETAITGPTLLGDLVDCLENRYTNRQIPVYTADFEVGTGQWPVRSQVLKRMDMGDARYDLMNHGQINAVTRNNLTQSWYPTDPMWRYSAMRNAEVFFYKLTQYLERMK